MEFRGYKYFDGDMSQQIPQKLYENPGELSQGQEKGKVRLDAWHIL